MHEDHSHHDTTNLSREDLVLAERRAVKLEDHIQKFFTSFWSQNIPPHKVKKHLDKLLNQDVLLTSVRRALSNLTRDGILEKMDVKVPGPHGSPVHCWRLKPQDGLFSIPNNNQKNYGGLQ